MNGELEIPASAFKVKADYYERPDHLVKVIKEFIRATGSPHLWPGHTHTKPTVGSRVSFIGKYSLPKTHHKRSKWAPCPCCSPTKPKYFRQGLIAWFPDEGVIRCVGDKCYKHMDPEGYRLAMEQLEAEIAAQNTTNYLLRRLPQIGEYVRIIDECLPIVGAIDEMKDWLNKTIRERLDVDLWPYVRHGILQLPVFRKTIFKHPDGTETVQNKPDFQDYGRLDGRAALHSESMRLVRYLTFAREQLLSVYFEGDIERQLAKKTESEMHQIAKILKDAHARAIRLISDATEVRRFFSRYVLNTFNSWNSQLIDRLPVHLRMDDEGMYVSRSEEGGFFKPWPEHFWDRAPNMEPLLKTEAA